MATFYEKPSQKLGVGDGVTHYNDGQDGYPEKTVNGKVTEVGDESFEVQWEDLDEPTEYDWDKVTIKSGQIFTSNRNNTNTKTGEGILTEAMIMERVNLMCEQSLSPHAFECWEVTRNELFSNRKQLNKPTVTN